MIAALLAEIERLKPRVGWTRPAPRRRLGRTGWRRGPDAPGSRGMRSPRPRGGQPGHEGHALAWRGDPDRVAVVMLSRCAGCGHDLAGLEGAAAARVQVSDTPPVRLLRSKHVEPGRQGRPAGLQPCRVMDGAKAFSPAAVTASGNVTGLQRPVLAQVRVCRRILGAR